MKEFLGKMDYDEKEFVGDEESAIQELDGYSSGVDEAVSEIADSYIPVYNGDIWEKGAKLEDYIQDALNEGLSDTTDIIRILQAGIYGYYERVLLDNLKAYAYNKLVDLVNEFLNTLTPGQIEKIDIDDIENEIDTESDDFDMNNSLDELQDKADSIIDNIKEELGIEEEE